MLRSFSVENYRSFNSAEIEVRPITLLLGKNSSGKSSLTRLVPLLRQSFNRLTASPVLWASDVVDFGNISNVIHHDTPGSSIGISLEVDPTVFYQYLNTRTFGWSTTPSPPSKLAFSARLASDSDKTVYEKTTIEIGEDRLDITWGERTIKYVEVNGRRVHDYFPPENIYADTTNLFPTIEYKAETDRTSPVGIGISIPSYGNVHRALEHFLRKKTNAVKREQIRRGLHYVARAGMAQYLGTFENIVRSRLGDTAEVSALSEALMVQDLPKFLAFFEGWVRPALESSSYLGPSRASGSRFYRMQELSVDRIDHRGSNLPMYLASLNDVERQRLNEMIMDAFGISVHIKPITGHVSVEIGTGDNFENLADVGFGYSQLLPIVAQIHASTVRMDTTAQQRYGSHRRSYTLMAIEQPELHLHPAMQASLGDLFAAAIKGSERGKRGLHLLVETHSEALIARISTLVALGQLRAEDVAIYVVEKDTQTKTSQVRRARIDRSGALTNWPIGFFAAPI